MSDPFPPPPRNPEASTEPGSRGDPPRNRGRAESFRAISDLLRWAYGAGARREDSDPPSTQGDAGHPKTRRGPAFDATEWEEAGATRFSAPGDRLGRFTLGRELGRGGFGIVYLAFDTRLGRDVALKVPRPDRVQNAAIWGRFAQEARLAASLDHEAIVPVLDAGMIDGTFYLATAYQNGEPLSRWIARQPGGVSARAAAALMARLASGLAYAHGRGVLHRDLKPGNVLMVSAEGDEGLNQLPRITDFGLGTFHDEDETGTLTGFWLGTPPYMAPEQVLPDRGPVDSGADLYALGAILYELLTGRPVYSCRTIWTLSVRLGRGEPPVRPRQIRREIPRDLETICLKCLDHDTARRYRSASALHEDLARFLRGEPIRARPRPAWARLGLWARRNPSRAGLVLGAAATAGLVAGLVAWHQASLSASNARLNRANIELEATIAKLKASERAKRHAAYATELHLADQELGSERPELAQSILNREKSTPGQEDLRDFTWRLLWRRATRSYEVSPLRDLSWWSGPKRKGGGPVDTPSKALIDLFGGNVKLDPESITSAGLAVTARYDGEFRGFYFVGQDGRTLSSLWFDDGLRTAELGIPPHRPAISPDGRTLALSDHGWVLTAPGEAPPARIRPFAPDIAGPSRMPSRIVEVPSAFNLSYSGDGRVLAIQAHLAEVEEVVPLIYEPETGRQRALSDRTGNPYIGRKLDPSANPRDRDQQTVLVLSRDGRLAAQSEYAMKVRVFDTATGETRWTLGDDAFGARALATCLAFSPDDKVLITGDNLGDVRVWDAADGHLRARFPGNLGYIRSVGWYPDARTAAIIAGSEDSIRFWRYAPAPPLPDRIEHGKEVWDLAFVAEGRILVSAGDDHRIRLWDAASCKPLKTLDAREGLVTTMAAAGGDGIVYSGDYLGRVGMFKIEPTGEIQAGPLTPPLFQGSKIRSLARSRDGRFLAAGGIPSTLWVRDSVEGTDRFLPTPHRQNLYAIAFSPDGKTLALGSDDRSISLWDLPGLTLRSTLPTRGQVACLAYSPDSGRLVASDSEGRLQFWEQRGTDLVPAGVVERATETGGVWDLAFSPDGKTLATGGDDATVRLWDPASARELLRISGHTHKVHAVAFSPDGQTLASADFDGHIRLHRAGPTPGQSRP